MPAAQTASAVFNALIAALEADNGGKFFPTQHQTQYALENIDRILKGGLIFTEDMIWEIAAGEMSATGPLNVPDVPGMRELHTTLNNIFKL